MDFAALYLDVGRRIALRRSALGVTQADLAGRVFLSRASIANIERGYQKLSLHQVYVLAEALGLRPLDLLPEAPASTPESAVAITGAEDLSEAARRQVEQIFNDVETTS